MTNRITIRKFSDKDFNLYYSLVSNEKVMAMVTERAIPLEEAKVDFKGLIGKNKRHESFGNFIIYNTENNEFLGLGKLEINHENPSEAELGYLLLPEFWGKGYGSEIGEALLKMAQELKGINRLIAIIDPKNIASKKILLNNGFISEKICEIDGLPGEILGRNI